MEKMGGGCIFFNFRKKNEKLWNKWVVGVIFLIMGLKIKTGFFDKHH